MTVRELIASLQQFDQNLPVYYSDFENGDEEVGSLKLVEPKNRFVVGDFPKRVVLS